MLVRFPFLCSSSWILFFVFFNHFMLSLKILIKMFCKKLTVFHGVFEGFNFYLFLLILFRCLCFSLTQFVLKNVDSITEAPIFDHCLWFLFWLGFVLKRVFLIGRNEDSKSTASAQVVGKFYWLTFCRIILNLNWFFLTSIGFVFSVHLYLIHTSIVIIIPAEKPGNVSIYGNIIKFWP